MFVAQQVVGMHLGAEHKLDARQVARSQIELLAELLAGLNQQRRLSGIELCDRRAEELGLGLGNLERLDHRQLAVRDLRRDGRAQRGPSASSAGRRTRSCAASVRVPCRRSATAGSGSTQCARGRSLLLP